MTDHHHRDDQRAGRRQDLRNRESKPRRTIKLSTVLEVVALLLLAALYETAPSRNFPECAGDNIPRYCVD